MSKKKRRSSDILLNLQDIKPLTKNQEVTLASEKNLVLCGSAGAGKSFLACYLGASGVAEGDYDSMTIIRSAVPTRDMGFLPGDLKEKGRIYEAPYVSICSELFERGDAYEIAQKHGIIKFMTTSNIRGITLLGTVVIIDEVQNMTFQELDSLITRIGQGCRVILCGDFKQADLKENGMKKFLNILSNMKDSFDIVDFGIEDVVRSGFVKDYLRTKDALERDI